MAKYAAVNGYAIAEQSAFPHKQMTLETCSGIRVIWWVGQVAGRVSYSLAKGVVVEGDGGAGGYVDDSQLA